MNPRVIKWFLDEEDGQGMVEYGLIIALVSVVILVALASYQGAREGLFVSVQNSIENAIHG